MSISRRVVLNGIGQSATLGALAAALPAQLRAAEAAPAAAAATYCLTRIYRPGEGLAFDSDGFRDRHLPTMIKAYGKTADRVELRVPAPVQAGAPAPLIMATVNIWFRDVQGFLGKHKDAAKDLTASMEQITKAPAVEQVDQVLASLGDERVSVPIDCLCLSMYFPTKEGGTMDTKYFAETFYPKFAEKYGSPAIRRIEVTGAATPKSPVVGATHVYIRDEEKFDAAATTNADLFTELQDKTNIAPLRTLTRLHASG
jgi:hypothetical protein